MYYEKRIFGRSSRFTARRSFSSVMLVLKFHDACTVSLSTFAILIFNSSTHCPASHQSPLHSSVLDPSCRLRLRNGAPRKSPSKPLLEGDIHSVICPLIK